MRVSSRAAKQCGLPAATGVVPGLSCIPVFASCGGLQAPGSFDDFSSFLAERASRISQLLPLIHPRRVSACYYSCVITGLSADALNPRTSTKASSSQLKSSTCRDLWSSPGRPTGTRPSLGFPPSRVSCSGLGGSGTRGFKAGATTSDLQASGSELCLNLVRSLRNR